MNRKSGNSYPNIASTWRKGFQITVALLFALVMYVLLFSGPFHNKPTDRKVLTELQLEQIKTVLNDMKRICGRYPTTSEGLIALFEKPASLNCQRYPQEGFSSDMPGNRKATLIDVWDQPYKYTSDGNRFRIEASHGIYIDGP